ncbi:AfsR/SARP family transcriptional regulator [Sphaerisporangium rubeum]|uniref:DNA-binding SARP family transcriptional activator/tetratricopeptide (TPR) repeat protein n=1 Tax=Sphaerisporangium rubeum TaxID=321317 RepID=A0A7X0M7S0_9ACTN|nr:AfsR/SARP family transcriptional regulator [Sphaerisporangium rubeum]MBB6474845.1 DNA-binding SARP family transcriptional activator/tetratricopeptide (TPR) repeat protein [Sphaerisporangium rubeum]
MELRLLGPVEVWNGERQVPLGGGKPRALLAALLLDAGRVVTVERLMEAIWQEDPPVTARGVLQTYVASLRRAFTAAGLPAIIVSHRVGYAAEVPHDALDRCVFERLVEDGRRAARGGDHAGAARSLREALALWRGPALGGIDDACLRSEVARLEELRLTVVEERVAADLAAGRAEGLVDELTELVAAHPARERLRRDLMVALYRSGRQTDALAVYQQSRRVLVEELGIEPGPELQAVHEAVLRSDPALLGPARPAPPRQLPPPPPDFTARDEEIAELAGRLGKPDARPVCVIFGPGGVGKSALALSAAHELADLYPDGQLHVELRGTSEAPATPLEVLGRLLRELEPGASPPATPEECAARYRTLLADRRKLVVLDDAATERQVRPLLPGARGCGVIVTSRNRLSGLAGATVLDLGLLPDAAATRLLARVAGPERVAAEPQAAERIVRQCGGLPLALRIAGARLASRRQWSVARLADRLADEQRRLDELAVGDQEVRAGIALSYDMLPGQAKTALRRLGLLGLPYFPVWVAATAMETGLDEAERVLDHLVDTSLASVVDIDAAGRTRYRLHDLIRLFARERAHAEEERAGREAVVRRVLGGWLWLVERLSEAVPTGAIPMRATPGLARPVDAEVLRVALADPHGWLRGEEEALIVAVELAAALDLDDIAVELAAALSSVAFEGSQYVFDNPFAAWHRTHEAALAVARRTDNALGEATLLAGLGHLYYERDQYSESREYLSQALSLFRTARDARGEAATLAALGAACREQGYLPEALHFLNRAGLLWADLADPAALAHVRRLAGSVHLERGDYAAARAELTGALSLYQAEGNRRGEGLTLRTLSMYHRARGELTRSAELCERALAIFRELGDRLLEAYCMRSLGKTLTRLGRHDAARGELTGSLAVTRSLHDRWGEACSLRTLGELDLAEGRLYQAKERLTEALALWETLRAALFRARTQRDLARVHEALGDDDAAKKIMAEALETFRLHEAREFTELGG